LSIAITCHGCGQRFDVPGDYPRRKVRCAACGVYCELPEPARKSEAAKPAAKTAVPAPAARKPPKAAPAAPPAAEPIFQDTYREDTVARPAPKLPASPDPLPKLPTGMPQAKPAASGDAMYQFADADLKKCPDCRKDLPPDARLCVHCGFNLETGKRPVKVFEEVHKIWEAGWPYARRRNLYILCQAVILPLGLLGAAFTGRWAAFLTPWCTFSVLLAFILGTFDRLDFTRDRRGRTRLIKTWRYLFLARPPEVIDLRDYEGVATGPADKNIMDWIVCLALAPSVIFAILWWLYVVRAPDFHVSLTQHHGFPEMPLYKGSNQNRVKEIADTLHEMAGVPYSG